MCRQLALIPSIRNSSSFCGAETWTKFKCVSLQIPRSTAQGVFRGMRPRHCQCVVPRRSPHAASTEAGSQGSSAALSYTSLSWHPQFSFLINILVSIQNNEFYHNIFIQIYLHTLFVFAHHYPPLSLLTGLLPVLKQSPICFHYVLSDLMPTDERKQTRLSLSLLIVPAPQLLPRFPVTDLYMCHVCVYLHDTKCAICLSWLILPNTMISSFYPFSYKWHSLFLMAGQNSIVSVCPLFIYSRGEASQLVLFCILGTGNRLAPQFPIRDSWFILYSF